MSLLDTPTTATANNLGDVSSW